MTMKHMLSAAVAASACALFATSTPEGWTDDFDAAKAQAKSEGKLLLVDFSGSDWCGWCKKLDKEVFATPEFLAGVKDDYVLVMVDSPSNKSLLSDKPRSRTRSLSASTRRPATRPCWSWIRKARSSRRPATATADPSRMSNTCRR